jgi:hypothetical protein
MENATPKDMMEHLALALAKTHADAKSDPDKFRVWQAALAIHVKQGGAPIAGESPMLGDLLAAETTREKNKMRERGEIP